ncbi:MAG TPA: hypothetical protein VK780_10850 [Thermoanaerobaculia bacterium]|nr:hypothetical protein [Thermoanaerobaculia bacterium]
MTGPMKKNPGYLFVLGDVAMFLFAAATYFVTFGVPLLLIWRFRTASPLALLALAIAGYVLALLIFIGMLVGAKKVIAGPIPPGQYPVTDPLFYRWTFAVRLVCLYESSPFRWLINDFSFFRLLFFRGMGTRISTDVWVALRVSMMDPWTLAIGHNTIIGQEALITGHLVIQDQLYVEKVEIGSDVVVGARAMIGPGVRIGDGAIIAPGAGLLPYSVVPPGQTWSGTPAQPVSGIGENAAKGSAAPDDV